MIGTNRAGQPWAWPGDLVMYVIKIEGSALRRGGPCARPRCPGCGPKGSHRAAATKANVFSDPSILVDALHW